MMNFEPLFNSCNTLDYPQKRTVSDSFWTLMALSCNGRFAVSDGTYCPLVDLICKYRHRSTFLVTRITNVKEEAYSMLCKT